MDELRFLLARNGFSFKKQLGQNFISDETLLQEIVALASVGEGDTVLEVGPGAGTLTRELARKAKKVVSYEVDKNLQPILRETLSDFDNVEVIFRDFLKTNLAEEEKSLGEYIVVANIPYYITTPLVMRFVEESQKAKRIVVMVQEEVARRFCAEADTPDYGAVTAAIALRGRAQIVKTVPRDYFFPRPNVDSAVVRIDLEKNRIPVQDVNVYRETVRCAFLNRRKTLENNLMQSFAMTREEARELLTEAGVDEKARGETLSPERLAALSDLVLRYKKAKNRA